MSIQEKYIKDLLQDEYVESDSFREKKKHKVKLYTHNKTQKKLIYIEISGKNDAVFRKLKNQKLQNMPIIYDACCGDTSVILLEEYITGQCLADIVDSSAISKKQAIKYCLDICNALKCLHNKGIVHRDVKPLNIIINENDEAILIDFHSARLISSEKQNDTFNLGTAGYAAPEQYGVCQSSPATDIFSLGVMLNEMILKTHPSIKVPSGKLGRIIKKCTNMQILLRYQSVDELEKDLKKALKYNRFKRKWK